MNRFAALIATVAIGLCLGAALSVTGTASATSLPEYVTVPAVKGYAESRAQCRLAEAGLKWRYRGFARVYSKPQNCAAGMSFEPDSLVTSQSVRARAKARYGTVVVIDTHCNKLARGKTGMRCL